MSKQTKRFRNLGQPDELFGHPCKFNVSNDRIEVTFNRIKVSDVPFKESIFSYNNKNWIIILSDDSGGKLNIGTNEQDYLNYKVIAMDKDSYESHGFSLDKIAES